MILTPAARLFWGAPLNFVGVTTEPMTGETFPVFDHRIVEGS